MLESFIGHQYRPAYATVMTGCETCKAVWSGLSYRYSYSIHEMCFQRCVSGRVLCGRLVGMIGTGVCLCASGDAAVV